jgi:hypothetical protein
MAPPSRKRSRSLGDILDQTAPEPAPEPPPPDPPPLPSPPAVPEKPWKYTLLLDRADYDRANDVEADVVKRSGIRRRKSMRGELVRALLAEAEADEQLRERVAARLRDGQPS